MVRVLIVMFAFFLGGQGRGHGHIEGKSSHAFQIIELGMHISMMRRQGFGRPTRGCRRPAGTTTRVVVVMATLFDLTLPRGDGSSRSNGHLAVCGHCHGGGGGGRHSACSSSGRGSHLTFGLEGRKQTCFLLGGHGRNCNTSFDRGRGSTTLPRVTTGTAFRGSFGRIGYRFRLGIIATIIVMLVLFLVAPPLLPPEFLFFLDDRIQELGTGIAELSSWQTRHGTTLLPLLLLTL